ncbi:MAG: glycosyltransferase [Bacteroidales bacterium]|nr:glycosyltransferase [Bacteroidales bacterium]
MRFSIITATRNRASLLQATLDSVLAQRDVDIELVIVDGNSSDNPLEVVRTIAEANPSRVKWISAPDNGVYQALNRGLTLATGDVIGILHAGDLYSSEDILSQVQQAFESTGAPFVYGDIHFTNRQTGRVTRLYRSDRFTPDLLQIGFCPPHPSLYLTRETVGKVGLYNENYIIAGDFDYFVRMAGRLGLKGQYLPVDMVDMATGGLSATLKARLITNNLEKLRALRSNGYRVWPWTLLRRYFYNYQKH